MLDTPLVFVELSSPKYYNFSTDRIFVKISCKFIEELKKKIDKFALGKAILEQFTSRDGFISFYSNDVNEWLGQKEPWDHNQVCLLLEVLLVSKYGEDWEVQTLEDCGW